MRNCPNCGKEIQNEAIFCRFCRRDVDPPTWLDTLQKCPYCAEWVERGLENCPLCEKPLSTYKEAKTPPFTAMHPDDLIANLRTQAGTAPEEQPRPSFLDRLRDTGREEEEQDFDLPEEEEEELEPLPVPQARRNTSDLDGEDIPSGFHAVESESRGFSLPFDAGVVLRYLLIVIFLGAVIGGIVYLLRGPARPLISSLLTPAPTPSRTPSPAPTETIVAATLPPLTDEQTPAPDATSQVQSPDECLNWDTITVQDEGSHLCVYGVVRRWFSAENIPFFAIFSEEVGTFAFVDYNTTYSSVRPGVCIQDTGYIEISPAGRPYMDLRGEFEICEEEPQSTP